MNILSKETISGIEALKDFYSGGLKFGEKFSEKNCLKFLQTFELMGIPVCYKENFASPAHFPGVINFCDEELKLFGLLKQTGLEIFDNEDFKELEELYSDIIKTLPEETAKKFEKYVSDCNIKKISSVHKYKIHIKDYVGLDKRIRIITEGKEITAEPVEVFKKSGLDYLKFFDVLKNDFDDIPVSLIKEIIVTDISVKGNKFPVNRTFRIYGRLKDNYRLRENEKIVDMNEEFYTVSNSEENETELFKRILKYGENCEFVYPVHLKEKFAEFVKQIKNIQVSGDFSK